MRKAMIMLLSVLLLGTSFAVAERENEACITAKPLGSESDASGVDTVQELNDISKLAKMTVMVYMCGSNLESEYGAATMDLQEMFRARAGNEAVSVLVLVGGTNGWVTGYNPEETSILKLVDGRPETVWRSEKRDMGDYATLTDFLRFGREKYPAEQYALILWDHGGGALEGVCWDEQFPSSRLSIEEIRKAVVEADMGGKLSWIGFDACLMGSLEVASGLSSVADYMIASQETEPSFGWNYAFLKDIETDRNPVDTGKRIIDSYFEGHDKSREPMTLACIDLSKAVAAAEATGEFFAEVEKHISADNYPVLAHIRGNTRDFGSGLRAIEEDGGYDLVDAEDLILQISGDESRKETALNAIREAVVYRRSNVDRSCGLTLYHPWQNKDRYASEWKDSYRSMNLIRGYTKYIQSFGALLMEKELIRWRNLLTRQEGTDENGMKFFSLPLTEEETQHVASAQLLIVKEQFGGKLAGGVNVVGVVHAELTEDNQIKAAYSERAIYVEKEDGEQFGPLSYMQTSDGAYNVISTLFIPQGEYGFDHARRVLFYLDAADPSDTPEIAYTRIWDEETHSYSSRIPFDRDQYRMVNFWDTNKSYPAEEEGVLPDYYAWEDGTVISHYVLPLPDDWHFVIRNKPLTGQKLYAMFRITDVQQNICCSVPVLIENDYRKSFRMIPTDGEIPDLEIAMTAYLETSDNRLLHLEMEARNIGKETIALESEGILVNDDRELNRSSLRESISAGETASRYWDIPADQLAMLDEGESLTLAVEYSRGNESGRRILSYRLEDCDLDEIRVPDSMGHAEMDGISMDLVRITPHATGGFQVNVLVRNGRNRAVEMDDLILNGYQLRCNAYESIGAGKSRVLECYWENRIEMDSVELDIPGKEDVFYSTVLVDHWLAQHRQEEIQSFGGLYREKGDWGRNQMFMLSGCLTEPWTVRESENPNGPLLFSEVIHPPEAGGDYPWTVLADNSRWQVRLRHVILGGKNLAMTMELENKTDEILSIEERAFMINGEKVTLHLGSDISSLYGCSVSPGCIRAVGLSADVSVLMERDREIRSISMTLAEIGGTSENTETILFHVPLRKGEDGKLQWFSLEETEILSEPEKQEEATAEDPEARAIEAEIPLPENAATYARWIKAPLSSREIENAEKGELVLVIPADDEYWVVGSQKLEFNESGELGAFFPGLVLCVSNEEADLMPVNYDRVGEDGFSMDALNPAWVEHMDFHNYISMELKSIKIWADYAENRCTVTEITTGGDEITKQSEMDTMEWYVKHGRLPQDEQGNLVSFRDMELNTETLVGWGEYLSGSPLQLKMRPIREDDRILFLFSVYNRDGTGYSKLVPWQESVTEN